MSPRPADAQPAPRVCLVGPLPPPSGGMANQCEQLLRLLRADGVPVELVRTNAPYHPAWIGRIPVVRALARLLPYLVGLWRAAGRADVMHVMANSGWAWHLFAAPAIWIARRRGTPVIVNYRGGLADSFLASAPAHVRRALAGADLRVTPSAFLQRVFATYGLDAAIIPNIVDLSRFAPAPRPDPGDAPRLLVARNLEPIYDIGTALRAFARVRERFAGARLTVAGSGPELGRLRELARSLGVAEAVEFSGRIDNSRMPQQYDAADLTLNPSKADNMPISILEAFASGVPVVSTDAGGIPDIVDNGRSGLLVPVGNAQAMADAACRLLDNRELARAMAEAGLAAAQAYAWPSVGSAWLAAYRRTARARTGTLHHASA